ncbi:MAG: CAP domain-containing protein [Meiothermus sp.]|uniref:CAP domain-containing protein n=1 Tax=Meiothermus sp. TaxID=1955249 RepID=UPI0025CFFD57|nr:CAP domain-containing protein [Meiothermus sp.]MCS7194588.1 CAP domain-containing protein [Meiothermus sp.]
MKPWTLAWLLLGLAACNPSTTPDSPSPPPGSLPTCSAVAFSADGPGLNSTTFTQALNQIRATPCRCAREAFANPSAAVVWNNRLEAAAQAHSQDMQQNNFFSHTGSDGSNPGQRITRTGYNAASWGENIAAGYTDMNAVLRGWLESQRGHCEAIKDPRFSEIGAALVWGSPSNTYRTYWTLVLARPRG